MLDAFESNTMSTSSINSGELWNDSVFMNKSEDMGEIDYLALAAFMTGEKRPEGAEKRVMKEKLILEHAGLRSYWSNWC